MSKWEDKYFQRFDFDSESLHRFWQGAARDLEIAAESTIPEVRFTYSYQSLIKIGITLIAKIGHAKVRSVPGHHVKVLEKMSEILEDPDILVMGNVMRTKRNLDFYGGGYSVTEREADDYYRFVKATLATARKHYLGSP